jgi:hypothetical protein
MPALWRQLQAIALIPLNENHHLLRHERSTAATQAPAPREMIAA